MRVIHNILLILIISVVMLALLSCTSSHVPPGAAGVHKSHAIKLQVTTAGTELKVNTGPTSKCLAATHRNGCVDVPRGDTVAVTFELIGSPQWSLKALKICKGGPKSSLLTCSLEFRQRADYEISGGGTSLILVPTDKGEVNLKLLSVGNSILNKLSTRACNIALYIESLAIPAVVKEAWDAVSRRARYGCPASGRHPPSRSVPRAYHAPVR